jgi:hypothetical protein
MWEMMEYSRKTPRLGLANRDRSVMAMLTLGRAMYLLFFELNTSMWNDI